MRPLAEHIAKGLYGAFIVDPADGREEADELVMVMNGFDTNFDRANELYAANTIPFAYMHTPIQVARDELVRVYLVNVLEYDLINSFHLHGNLFNYFPTGTGQEPSELTDTVMLCQGQRGILEWRFPVRGQVHVPRAPVGVHRAGLAGLLRGHGLMEADRRASAATCGERAGGLPGCVAAAADRGRARRLRGARRAGPRRAPRAAGGGAGRREGGPEPGMIELTVRNDGPDAVAIAQAQVNDAFVQFDGPDGAIGRLETRRRARAPAVGGGGGLRGRADDVDRRDDRARDPRRRGDAAQRHSLLRR